MLSLVRWFHVLGLSLDNEISLCGAQVYIHTNDGNIQLNRDRD